MERDRWLALVLRTTLLVLFVWMIRSLLVPIALGALLALLLSPLQARVAPRLGKAKRFSPLLFTAASLVLVVIPFVFVTIEAVHSIAEFVSRDWSTTVAKVQGFLTDGIDIRGRSIHIGGEQLQQIVQNVGQRAASFAAGFVGGLATTLPNFIVGLFLFSVALFYGLRDGGALGRWMFRLSPFPTEQTRELFASVRETVNGAILGLVVTALVQGGLTVLALIIFGVPNAFLLGVLATLLAFIPLLGTTPITIGAAIYLFAGGRIGAGIGMLITAVIIGVSDNVIRPWVQSSRTSMHPLIALLAIFGGIAFFGASGVFLGPVIAAMAIWTIDTYAKLHPPHREITPPALAPKSAAPVAEEVLPLAPESGPRERDDAEPPSQGKAG
jgi:predicted PurR-regulated permease PerM